MFQAKANIITGNLTSPFLTFTIDYRVNDPEDAHLGGLRFEMPFIHTAEDAKRLRSQLEDACKIITIFIERAEAHEEQK
jgi:hypothetical protein